MSSRRENIQSTLKNNGRARTMMVIVGVVVLIMGVFGFLSITKKDPPAISESSSVPPPPNIRDIPGGSTDQGYNDLQQQDNAARAAAAKPGDTTLPTMIADPNNAAATPWTENTPVAPPVVEPPVVQPTQTPVVTPPAPVQVQPVYQPSLAPEPVAAAPQVDQRALDDRYQATSTQLNNYLASWALVPTGSQEFNYNGERPKEGEGGGASGAGSTPTSGMGSAVAQAGGSSSGSRGSQQNQPSLVRAGTVIPAVLLSAVNSDNKGPVLAQITTGPLAGTRLLGSFAANKKALVLTFETMSSPRLGTFSIKALAVDEKYAVGMATDVDSHWFRRYGLLLAGSLLEGYGEAMGRANTVIVTGPLGTTTTQGELSSKEVNAVALGQVGQTMSQELINQSRVEPTIHLDCKGGCPVGILFMSDL